MENNQLNEFQITQIAVAIESCEFFEKYGSKLKPILVKLQKTSEEIIEHVMHGDLSNQERNRELWHELNNIEHQLKQFIRYTESSVNEIAASSAKLIENLRSLRPAKDNLH